MPNLNDTKPRSTARQQTLTPATEGRLRDFFAAVHDAPQAILLLDFDGTLAPFRIDRYQARPYAGVRRLIEQIQKRDRTRLAVVTGRPAEEIAPVLALDTPIEVWGLHGAERIHADGRREIETPSAQVSERLEALRAQLKRDSFGGLIEDKANGIVMHWRGASPQRARMIERKTRVLFEPAATLGGLSLLDFEAGVELRIGRDKGGAVEAILAENRILAGADAPVAYLGDDLTDESAFRTIHSAPNPSLSVLMRRALRETAADIWLRPPEDLRAFLKRWASSQEP
jgi:trehalose 6-phosphate phosphatase